MTSKGLETEIGNRNRNKKVPQSWPKQPTPVSVSLKCDWNRNKTETETVFKGGWQFEKILGQNLFLSISLSKSPSLRNPVLYGNRAGYLKLRITEWCMKHCRLKGKQCRIRQIGLPFTIDKTKSLKYEINFLNVD